MRVPALLLAFLFAGAPALAQPAQPARHVPLRALSFESGTGQVITLAQPAANIFVADPKVAEVRPGSPTSLFVFGVAVGRTTVAVMDSAGAVVAQYQITVRPSGYLAGQAQAELHRVFGSDKFTVSPEARGVLLTGTAASAAEAAQAVAVVRGLLPDGQTVDSQVTVHAPQQVNLQVRIVEMSRRVTRALGINWNNLASLSTAYGVATTGVGNALGSLTARFGTITGAHDLNVLIDALATDNLARSLAEPNLTVISGEAGSFLVGGEFPIPVAQQNNETTIEFKKYGVALRFVPTVLADGRINLNVSPEVSELTQQGAITLSSSNTTISIPALTVRRAETTVQLGSGQTFALAGLLQDTSSTTTNGLPGLGDLPGVGALFRSNGFQRQETELVILVTPYVVRPVDDPQALTVPGAGSPVANDLERILLNREIAQGGPATPVHIPGDAGFIVQ
jgi:pilus assembly protein CpaC